MIRLLNSLIIVAFLVFGFYMVFEAAKTIIEVTGAVQ